MMSKAEGLMWLNKERHSRIFLAYFVEVYSTQHSMTERSIQGHKVRCTVCYHLSVFEF